MHKISLNAFDKTYEIVGFKHSMFRDYESSGYCYPKSGLVGGFFQVEFASDADVSFLEKMVMIEWGERNFETLSDDDYVRMNCFSGKLSCHFNEAESGKVYEWKHAIVTYYEEIAHSLTGKPMKTRVVFSPFDLRVNNLLISRYSGKTEKGTWFFYEPEEEKQPKPAPKPTILVTKLKSDKKEALPNEKVTYQVTEFNQKQVSESDKKRIHWQVKVDGKKAEEFLRHGEKLELTIKEEWAGKEIIVMPFLVKPTGRVSKKTKINEKSHIRLVITNEITGYTIQNLKGLDYVFSDPAVIVPTYRVDVVNYDKNNTEGKIEFSFSVTRDAWYNLGKEEKKYKLLNRAFIPKNWDQNLYGAYWIPSYPKFSGMGAFILTRFGERKLPAKPLLTQKLLNGKDIESPRKDENIATDVMIHMGGTYEIMGYDYLGGSYGCFGFIPESNIHKTPELAKKAIKNDTYDDNISNKVWKEITNKILNLSFESKKDIKILLEYRDENLSYKPKFIYEE